MGISNFLHLEGNKKKQDLKIKKGHKSSRLLLHNLRKRHLTKLLRCVGPGSWAWRYPGQSACFPPGQWLVPPASSAAPRPSARLSSWSPRPWVAKTINIKAAYNHIQTHKEGPNSVGRPSSKYFDTHFLDFSSLRTLASALALFSSLLASASCSFFASIWF